MPTARDLHKGIFAEIFLQPDGLSRITFLAFGKCFGRTFKYDVAAFFTAFRPQIDDVVGTFDDFRVVLDDDNGVPAFDKRVQGFHQGFYVMEVQAGRRLVKDENGRRGLFGG